MFFEKDALRRAGIGLSIALATATLASATDKAIVIGNSDYSAAVPAVWGNLPGAGVDADGMAVILMQAGYDVTKLKDLTAQEIKDAIVCPPEDCCLIIYYAGHGEIDDACDGGANHGALCTIPADCPGGDCLTAQGALVGVDGQYVTAADFAALLSSCKERTLAILDSCGSGAFATAAEDGANRPGFMTATTGLQCATKTGGGGDFTNSLRECLCVDIDPIRTVSEADACLTSGYDETFQDHYYNGKLPDKVLSNKDNPVHALPAWGFASLILCLLASATVALRHNNRLAT